MIYLLSFIGIVVALWVFLSVCGFIPILLLRFANFSRVDKPIPIFNRSLSVLDPVWIEEAKFKGVGAIRPIGIPMAIYVNKSRTVAMVVYFAGGQRVLDFFSKFPNKVTLTTTSSIDGVTSPLPQGGMLQCFPNQDVRQQYQSHVKAIKYLQSQLNCKLVPLKSVSKAMKDFTHGQCDVLIFRPWKIFTLPYRYFVTRFTHKNHSVEQQVLKGRISIDLLRQQIASR